jgi:hypothetical protein
MSSREWPTVAFESAAGFVSRVVWWDQQNSIK